MREHPVETNLATMTEILGRLSVSAAFVALCMSSNAGLLVDLLMRLLWGLWRTSTEQSHQRKRSAWTACARLIISQHHRCENLASSLLECSLVDIHVQVTSWQRRRARHVLHGQTIWTKLRTLSWNWNLITEIGQQLTVLTQSPLFQACPSTLSSTYWSDLLRQRGSDKCAPLETRWTHQTASSESGFPSAKKTTPRVLKQFPRDKNKCVPLPNGIDHMAKRSSAHTQYSGPTFCPLGSGTL